MTRKHTTDSKKQKHGASEEGDTRQHREREGRTHEADGLARSAALGGSSGAQSSNTAPANCTNSHSTRILRCGIDSLYLSYAGNIDKFQDEKLSALKLAAQSSEIEERSTAQLFLAEHCFEVSDRGKGKYAYVISDNWFHIGVSSHNAKSMPLASVQISSEVLTLSDFSEACLKLDALVGKLGRIAERPKISRIDLCVDFVCENVIEGIQIHDWVTRANKANNYYVHKAVSGWMIGAGGAISARLYDKTLELQKSKKEYLKSLWKEGGWNEEQTVWRLEFQFRREALKELGVDFISQIDPNLGGLWLYATENWLKLTIPSQTDSTQSRWPIHPLWKTLSTASWVIDSSQPLERVRKNRAPSDQILFVNGLAPITSFMAKNKITDFNIGFIDFIEAAKKYHRDLSTIKPHNIFDYTREKAKEKGRRFNMIDNRKEGSCE